MMMLMSAPPCLGDRVLFTKLLSETRGDAVVNKIVRPARDDARALRIPRFKFPAPKAINLTVKFDGEG